MTRRAPAALLLAAGLVGGGLVATAPAQAANGPASVEGDLVVQGHGFGHGRGLSQYGARGAALEGQDVWRILDFYYPGTTNYRVGGDIRVRLDDRANGDGVVAGSTVPGALRMTDTGDGTTWVLDRDPQVRVVPGAGGRAVMQVGGAGRPWFTVRALAGPLQLEVTSGAVSLTAADGTVRSYRGTVTTALDGARVWAVNRLSLEDYLRGVVPAEMPTSWPAQAVRAQAVAARTYAINLKDAAAGRRAWDLCSTDACQVYRGTSVENAAGDSAVSATVGLVRLWGGKAAFTEFSSSNGGWTAAGAQPYAVAKEDPWDGAAGNPNSTWTATVSSSAIARAWPQVGAPRAVEVVARDGRGRDGGRSTRIAVRGDAGTVEVTGAAFRSKLGLKSDWVVLPSTSVPSLTGAIGERYRATGGAARWGVPLAAEFAAPSPRGSVAQGFSRSEAWWSAGTGAHFITGGILDRVRASGGVDVLGLPLDEEQVVSGTTSVVAQRFARSTAWWSAGTGAWTTRNAIDEAYRAAGGPLALGAPVEDERAVDGRVVQRFERGDAVWTPAGGVVLTPR